MSASFEQRNDGIYVGLDVVLLHYNLEYSDGFMWEAMVSICRDEGCAGEDSEVS